MPHTFPTVSNHNVNFKTAIQAAQNAVSKASIGTLKDVAAQGAEENYALLFNPTNEKWEAKPINNNIEDLQDVSTTDPTNGQVLKYITSTGLWTPSAVGALTANLEDLTDVDVATLPKYNGASLQFDGTNWITAPAADTIIWVTALGDNSNTGLETGESVADMQTAFQRVLQKGSVVSSRINLKLADVPWDTSARNLINVGLTNGPSFTRFVVNGNSQNFAQPTMATPPSRVTGAVLTGYALLSTNGTQTIANGWNCTTFPTALHWAEVAIDGGTSVLPVLVDDQTQNTGARVYISYWDKSTGAGFNSTPALLDRTIADSTTLTNSTSFYGPMTFTNLIIKGPDAGELKFLNDVSMEYIELSSTTANAQTTHVVFNGQNSQCRYCRFTDLTFACNGSSITPESDITTTFVNCIFYNCSFTEANNIKFLGCIFYRNPLLVNKKSVNMYFDTCTFIYSTFNTGSVLMYVQNNGHVILNNCVIDTPQYATGHDPVEHCLFEIEEKSTLDLLGVTILDGVLRTDATGAQQTLMGDVSIVRCSRSSSLDITGLNVTDSGAGDSALFNINSSRLSIDVGEYNTNLHTLVVAGNQSQVYINDLDDKVQCTDFIIGINSNIKLSSITAVVNGTYTISRNFMVLTYCTLLGTNLYIDLNHTGTTRFLECANSNVNITTTSNNGGATDAYGNLYVLRSMLRIINNWSGGGDKQVTFKNGTSSSADAVLYSEESTINLHDVSFTNEHLSSGTTITADQHSNIYMNYTSAVSGNGIINANNQALVVDNNSHVVINGKIELIKSVADNKSTIECHGNSSIVITPNFTLLENSNLVIQRNSNNTGTVPILSVTRGSKFYLANQSEDKDNSANTDDITITAPIFSLKGESTNTGQGPFLISRNSVCHIEQSVLVFAKLNGPGIIEQGSKFLLVQCVIQDTSGAGTRLSYFNVTDSELIITGLGSVIAYIPKIIVQAVDSDDQGVITPFSSKVTFSDMEIRSHVTIGTHQTVIRAKNNCVVDYLRPTKTSLNGFATGVQLRSNSKCVFKEAAADQLNCTQDILLGVLTGATDDTRRKLVDMGGGETIIPKQTGVTNYAALQLFIDAAEGCVATLAV